jgi:hypothetical protein
MKLHVAQINIQSEHEPINVSIKGVTIARKVQSGSAQGGLRD